MNVATEVTGHGSLAGPSFVGVGDRANAFLPVVAGLAVGVGQLAVPLVARWVDAVTVQSLLLAVIAAVYIGFAVADGRPKVIAVESTVAAAFVLLATVTVVAPVALLALAYAVHGLKDCWQHRTQFVATTRWWPPFCAAVDWVVAAALLFSVIAGIDLRG
jgi:hypothetical protein